MNLVNWALAVLIFAVVPAAAAQQTSDQKQNARQSKPMETKSNGNDIDTFVAQYKARQLVVPACKNLEGLGTVMDFSEKKATTTHIYTLSVGAASEIASRAFG